MPMREDNEPLEALPGGKEHFQPNLSPRATSPKDTESRGAVTRNVVIAILGLLLHCRDRGREPVVTQAEHASRGGLLAAATVGVGLSGFFDGILLHQVLQWHHLLSLVPGERFRDLGTQILADGLFHVLMYLVAATGLWLLWRYRFSLGGWRRVLGGGLLGFGLWNIVDVGFFHWILGIHRVRVDVADPMTYDLGWLLVFGLVPVANAFLLLRRRPPPANGRGGVGVAAGLALLALVAAPLAALPQPNANTAIAYFPPGARPAVAVNAAVSSRAGILWIDPDGRMMAVALTDPDTVRRLYRAGALLVTRSPAVAGCAASARI